MGPSQIMALASAIARRFAIFLRHRCCSTNSLRACLVPDPLHRGVFHFSISPEVTEGRSIGAGAPDVPAHRKGNLNYDLPRCPR
jgi:hypothetical protein